MMIIGRYKRIIFFVVSLLIVVLLAYVLQVFRSYNQQANILGVQPTWVFRADGEILSCLPENNSGIFVYTPTAIYLVDSITGELLWKTNLEEDTSIYRKYTIQTGIKSNEKVMVLQRDNGTVLSLSAKDGQVLWEGESETNAPIYDMGIDQDFVYVTRLSTSIVAYDAESGEKIWSKSVPDRTSLYLFPENEKVFLGTGYMLFAYDARTGDLLVEHILDGLMRKMFADANNIYIAYLDGKYSFTSLDKETLEYRWSIPSSLLSLSEVNAMLVKDDVVYVSGNKLVALSATNGEVLWVSDIEDVFGKPAIQNSFLVVQGRARVYVLNKIDGTLIDNQKISGFVPLISWMFYSQANPCASETMIWLSSNSFLYAYDLTR